jgi:hypothetical protein
MCQAGQWNSIPIDTTTLTPGSYFFVMQIDTLNMLGQAANFVGYQGQIVSGWSYGTPFPATCPTIAGAVAEIYAVYLPSAPFTNVTYSFANWENTATNPTRIVNLNSNMTVTAFYTQVS